MSHLDLDPAAVQELLNGPSGPVYRAVREFAQAVVDDVKEHGPLGFDQGGHRAIGLLRADMRIRFDTVAPDGPTIIVGTDPENPKDGYHYALAVHEGRGPISTTSNTMKFLDRAGRWHVRYSVGPATKKQFLYDAVDRVNLTREVRFEFRKTPAGPQ